MAGMRKTAPGGFLPEERFFWWRTSTTECHSHPLYSLGSVAVWGIPAHPVSWAFCRFQFTDNRKDMASEASVFLNIFLLVPEWCILRCNQPLCSCNKGAGGSNFGNADGPWLLPLLWAPLQNSALGAVWNVTSKTSATCLQQGFSCATTGGVDLSPQELYTFWGVSFL